MEREWHFPLLGIEAGPRCVGYIHYKDSTVLSSVLCILATFFIIKKKKLPCIAVVFAYLSYSAPFWLIS